MRSLTSHLSPVAQIQGNTHTLSFRSLFVEGEREGVHFPEDLSLPYSLFAFCPNESHRGDTASVNRSLVVLAAITSKVQVVLEALTNNTVANRTNTTDDTLLAIHTIMLHHFAISTRAVHIVVLFYSPIV